MQHGYVSAVVTKAKTGEKKQISLFKHNLLTDAGESWMHSQVYVNTAAGTRGAGYIAVTQSTITPAVGDTSLTGEMTTLGFTRVDATTKTYTGASNSTLVETTFTSTGAITSILASALFNQAGPPVAGTMPHIANFATGSGTMATNDTLKVSWTCTLG